MLTSSRVDQPQYREVGRTERESFLCDFQLGAVLL